MKEKDLCIDVRKITNLTSKNRIEGCVLDSSGLGERFKHSNKPCVP
jgi:hypothetical protein